jgi:hypothetical protein
VETLRTADQSAACWTWYPLQQDVAFITRHQVQEAAVHHWDAADATGAIWTIDPQVAADCVDEFLEFSLSTEVDPADPLPPPLGGAFALVAADVGVSWSVRDGSTPGTLAVDGAAAATVDEAVPVIEATAADLLLWLYERTEIDTSPVPAVLIERFRALTFTD